MPRERESITHKFSIAGHEGYITAGKYEDGTVGEIFLTDIGKEGSTLRGMMNAFATAISIGLQYGVPLEVFVNKFSYMRFDPEGITSNPEIPFAKSMPDYIMRWLGEPLHRRHRRRTRTSASSPPRSAPARRPSRRCSPDDGAGPPTATANGHAKGGNGEAKASRDGRGNAGCVAAAAALTDTPPVGPGPDARASTSAPPASSAAA